MSGLGADYGYLWPLCKNLATRGHEISIITTEGTQGPSVQTINGIQVNYLEGSPTSEFLLNTNTRESVLDRLEQLHLEKPFHIVHGVDHTSLYVAQNKASLEVALAMDVKSTKLDQIFGIIGLTEEKVSSYLTTSVAVTSKFLRSFFGDDHKLLKYADGVFVASLQQQDILERYYRVPSRKVHIIPYGIESKQFEATESNPNLLSDLGFDDETKVILTISALTNAQETKNLLSAFERVVIKKPKTALIIVGDGPKLKELEFFMLNLALGSKVRFVGACTSEQINQYINRCNVYCNLYSRSSGFEPTVLEAMANCKTVVASEVGTSSNVIENGKDGFLIRPTDIPALSRLLLEVVSDQIDLKSIGIQARQKILKMFDTRRMVDQTINAYHDILFMTGKYKKWSRLNN